LLILDRAQIHGYVKHVSFVDCFQKRWDLNECSCAFKCAVLTIKLSMTEKGGWRENLKNKAMKCFSENPRLETIIPARDTKESEKDELGKKKETAENFLLIERMRQSDRPSPIKTEIKSGGGEMNISESPTMLPLMLPAIFWGQETHVSSSKVDVQEDVKDMEHPTDWISDICDNEILAADPFKLLVVLLITYPGPPESSVILLMVEFAYVIAVAQASTALREAGGSQNLSPSIQMACLPFLRRAALLVVLLLLRVIIFQHGFCCQCFVYGF
jgi:hypothetical protein